MPLDAICHTLVKYSDTFHIGFSFVTLQSFYLTVSWMWLQPGMMMTDTVTTSCLMTDLVNLTMLLLPSFLLSLVGTAFKPCKSYSPHAFAGVALNWQRRDAAKKRSWTAKVCHPTVLFTRVTVDAGHGSLTKILVSWILAPGRLRPALLVSWPFCPARY